MFKYLLSFKLNPVQRTWAAAFFFTTIGNIALWQTLWINVDVHNIHNLLFFVSLPIFLFCFLSILLTPVMVIPYLCRPLLVVLILISACCSYFMMKYNILIDRSMVQNFFETNQAELTSYLSVPFLSTLFLLGIVPAIILALPSTDNKRGAFRIELWWLAHICIAVVLLAMVTMVFYKDYASLIRNNMQIKDQALPFNFVRNTNGYLKRKYQASSTILQSVGEDAVRPIYSNSPPKLVVVVVGETARAQNFQLNGYSRVTNPYLSRRHDVISFKNVSSCGTATAISLPCMFSRMSRNEYNEVRAASEENLLDILKRTGVEVLWRNNNNGGCKGICKRVPTDDMPAMKVIGECVNKDGTCFDEVLLNQLSSRINAMQGDALIVLHQMGSHGPTYFERYPSTSKVFSPTCDSNLIEKCSNKELVNTYDNTLVYTDRMLSKTIELLQRYSGMRDVAMIYLSDHGESLGESGIYLHGTPYIIAPNEQTHIPMIMWFSSSFAQHSKLNLECLTGNADKQYSHDNFFHSILGLFNVKTSVYKPELDMFTLCRQSDHTPLSSAVVREKTDGDG
ncbi:MCR-8 family phosphoethanolamine--lipid A transferase [Klebsiella pneumoniae]|uniref:Phosphoethanolamine transferase n=1 Tax=uncultured Klebsiella sp. TaxID=284011 RepID=A0A7D5AWD6_9ENTR|nr:MCR-8 family phosphoethanolamine--lipid A transferase [Klebsiella pneumoniae]MCX9759632.1 MCR-8 family phosphoethanolamine--lipid A transferase [Klebsiella pneumoniae]MCX9765591.1 MCR-8 family phosphoethanolamine--lipid A transferase [Klebsiella pneumoniae]QKV49902.1 phosphoethanolamine transferase [uncultured Klebsiella sp.]QKY83808.1 Phosphoethanolamine transferase EptA [Klebsiella pneumoniae]